ncbi:MAG: hypothetical protein ABR574_10385 [Cryomorphaceae bacterium]|nr:hypothetical protein [Flavobacteriales bacterium]
MCLLSLPIIAFCQQQKKNDIFPRFGNYERKGWIISPMLTQTSGPIKDQKQRLFLTGDSIFDVDYDARGKTAFGIEVGRFYAIDNSWLISYLDFSLGVKMLQGAEKFSATLDDPDRSTPYNLQGEGVFKHMYATASFNLSNAQELTKTVFLKNTIGINGDYRISDSQEYFNRGLPIQGAYPSQFIFQAHYSIGIGVQLSQNIMVVPSVETPIVTFYEYDDLKSTMAVFNSRYRPFLFKLTFMVLDKKPGRKCPTRSKPRKSSETLFGMADGIRPW